MYWVLGSGVEGKNPLYVTATAFSKTISIGAKITRSNTRCGEVAYFRGSKLKLSLVNVSFTVEEMKDVFPQSNGGVTWICQV